VLDFCAPGKSCGADRISKSVHERAQALFLRFVAGSIQLFRKCPQSEEEWVFPSPVTGRCYHASPIQQDYIRPAGRKLELGDIGWHTFRHTYRSWLDLVGTTIGVQQKLMRHAQIATTMNVYGNAMMESKREANTKVVQMAFRQGVRKAR